MKILLATLNSRYTHTNLALRSLYAVGQLYIPNLYVREFTINNTDDYIFTELVREDYDIIFFSCYIWNIEKTEYLCENLKKAKPEIKLIAGGPEVSPDCGAYLEKHPQFDAVIYGEGEMTFGMIMKALRDGSPKLSDIRGLAYREMNQVHVNEPMPPVSMDSIPFAYAYLPAEDDKIIYYESSRGCPYNCSYCMSSLEKMVRSLSIDRVKDELSYFIAKRVKQVKFIDRTFNWDKKRCNEIMEYLILMDNGITNFHFELCGELIDEAFLEIASRARKGLFQFEIGIQSTNPLTLKAVNRTGDVRKCLRNIRRLSKLGIAHVHIDLIVGLPFEHMNSLRTSFNNIYPVKADAIQVGFLKMIKGTAIRCNEGFYDYIYREKAPYEVISSGFMTAGEIAQMKQFETVIDLFYNRGGFENILSFLLEASGMEPFDLYMELAGFYYLKGYQHRNHRKEDLYRIMYGYVKWKVRFLDVPFETALFYLDGDLRARFSEDAVRRFMNKGWEYPGELTWQENIRV